MNIPRYIADYVAALSETDVRYQYARLLAKQHKERSAATRERWLPVPQQQEGA